MFLHLVKSLSDKISVRFVSCFASRQPSITSRQSHKIVSASNSAVVRAEDSIRSTAISRASFCSRDSFSDWIVFALVFHFSNVAAWSLYRRVVSASCWTSKSSL